MGTDKRDRQKARRAQRLEAAYRDYKRQLWRRRITTAAVVVAAVALGAFGVSLLVGDDGDEVTTPTSTTSTTLAPPVPITAPPAGEAVTGETECPAADGSSPRTTSFESAPPSCIDPSRSYTAEVATSAGTFTIDLDVAAAPVATNTFVVLSRYHYYDGVPFHRIVPGFVIEAGDATGDPVGTGDPGFTVEGETPTDLEAYETGTVALSVDADGTAAASRFFVYTGPSPLDGPRYPVLGRVGTGMDVVQEIARGGTATLGAYPIGTPDTAVVIESITISEA